MFNVESDGDNYGGCLFLLLKSIKCNQLMIKWNGFNRVINVQRVSNVILQSLSYDHVHMYAPT